MFSDRSGEKPYCTFIICIRFHFVNIRLQKKVHLFLNMYGISVFFENSRSFLQFFIAAKRQAKHARHVFPALHNANVAQIDFKFTEHTCNVSDHTRRDPEHRHKDRKRK